MALVATPAPSVSPSLSPTPSATPAVQHVLVVQPSVPAAPTIGNQLSQVDPLLWASLIGILVIPWLLELIKMLLLKLANWMKPDAAQIDDLGRRVHTALLGVASTASAYLVDTLSNGSLDQLHNPLLALILTAVIIFATGTASYQIVFKKDPQPAADPGSSNLPVNQNP